MLDDLSFHEKLQLVKNEIVSPNYFFKPSHETIENFRRTFYHDEKGKFA
jgi:hypothetical protein